LIEAYLKTLAKDEERTDELSLKVSRLLGSVKAPKDFDYKKELEISLGSNYLK
jgi:hypothetical protein